MYFEVGHRHLRVNGVGLHVAHGGAEDAPLVVLLHGFPEYWYGWRHQLGYLAAAGYRVWAPDQRGYNLSEKPAALDAYRLDVLAADVVGLIDAAGRDKASLVGHDWGAAVAWWTALRYPERVERLVAINVPHPSVMQLTLRRSLRQMIKSAYILFFQIPRLPEALARWGNWRLPARTLRSTSRAGTFGQAEMDCYREAWARPGAFTAMLNWYRALLRYPPAVPANPRITVPTLLLWGARDAFLTSAMAEQSMAWCNQGRLVMFEDATHWLQHEESERVNALIEEHLRHLRQPASSPSQGYSL